MLLDIVTATDFLTALTLISSFKAGGTVSCKKKDVLALKLTSYKKYADNLCMGFSIADKLLQEERIFSSRDLPYSTQLIPLAAICTVLMDGNKIYTTTVKNMVKQWYWCGVFGELYGSANETRYANDITQVIKWITDGGDLPKTITDFFFNPTRLLSLQSRQSAAYKGIMALILKNHARDFISGAEMDFSTYSNEKIDIHHIFPKDYCIGQGYDKNKWNSIVNKTPISASSNREIGGVAPSAYLGKLEKKGSVLPSDLDSYVETHWIDHDLLRKLCYQDDLVLNRLKAHLGVFALAPQFGVISPDYTVLIPNTERIIPSFGEMVLKSALCRRELRVRVRGIIEGFWRLYTDDFYTIYLPVPPIEEQKEIMQYVDAQAKMTAALENALNREIELLHELRTRLISDVVTGQIDVRSIEVPDFELVEELADEAEEPEDEMEVE